jgi:hypothetical protein
MIDLYVYRYVTNSSQNQLPKPLDKTHFYHCRAVSVHVLRFFGQIRLYRSASHNNTESRN